MTRSADNRTSPLLLRLSGVSFGYAQRELIRDLSIDVAPGFTWLKGGNGSGKSTLLKLVAGALPPATGRIELSGICQARDPLAYRRHVFWCGPGALPYDHLTALEYFGFMQGIYPALDTYAIARHISGFGLQPYAASVLRGLSTGTQRKVWLTAALSIRTPVVLLDEPLNALDAASRDHLIASLVAVPAEPNHIWIVASHEPFGPCGERARGLEMTDLCGIR